MKTLSDDITLTLDTSILTPGYVTTTIYYNSIKVFVGRTYVDSKHTPVDICLNDFIIQNHGRNDYLKLNNDGELVSNELDPGSEHASKFEVGQIGNYSVTLSDGEHSSNKDIKVVAAYNYQNKDIEPKIIDNDSSSEIGRIMQGCDWYVKNEDVFVNDENESKDVMTLYRISKDMAHASGYNFNATAGMVDVSAQKVLLFVMVPKL